jgi:hypothetical protein
LLVLASRLNKIYIYEQVKINEENGERYFCSESEAQAAGWKRAITAKQ